MLGRPVVDSGGTRGQTPAAPGACAEGRNRRLAGPPMLYGASRCSCDGLGGWLDRLGMFLPRDAHGNARRPWGDGRSAGGRFP